MTHLNILTTKAQSDGGVLLQRVTKGDMKGLFKPRFAVDVQVRCGTADAPTTEWVFFEPHFSHQGPVQLVTCDGTLAKQTVITMTDDIDGSEATQTAFRAWAEANDVIVSPRGRIKAEVLEQYRAAGH